MRRRMRLCQTFQCARRISLGERKIPFPRVCFLPDGTSGHGGSPPRCRPSDKRHLQPRHLSLVKYIAGGLLRGRLEIIDQKWLSNASNCYLCTHLHALLLCLLTYDCLLEGGEDGKNVSDQRNCWNLQTFEYIFLICFLPSVTFFLYLATILPIQCISWHELREAGVFIYTSKLVRYYVNAVKANCVKLVSGCMFTSCLNDFDLNINTTLAGTY